MFGFDNTKTLTEKVCVIGKVKMLLSCVSIFITHVNSFVFNVAWCNKRERRTCWHIYFVGCFMCDLCKEHVGLGWR